MQPAMLELAKKGASYRTQLGLVVAITEMLRKNKDIRAQISELLEDSDLNRLLSLSAHKDRTMRIHATEFLFDLGDPRLFGVVDDLWSDTSSADGRFNFALVLKGAAPQVDRSGTDAAKGQLESYIGSVGAETEQLLRHAIVLLPKA